MGKSSKAPDTSGLEEATKEATALQKQIYQETREDVQPWYKMGTGAVSSISDLLGISGGSVQSREDIYNELLPQYTSKASADGNYMLSPDGRLVSMGGETNEFFDKPQWVLDEIGASGNGVNLFGANSGVGGAAYADDPIEYLKQMGYKDYQSSSDTTDYEALNKAVEERLTAQSETPEGFGSLLERFDLDKFEEDPGYQFRQDEANKALERQMAAQGVTLGGGGAGVVSPQAYRAMQELNQGLASQEYSNAYNRYNADNMNTYNMLMGAAGMGQGSTAQMAAGGQNYATNVGNLQTGLAQAQYEASMANQGGSMFGTLLGAGAGALLAAPTGGMSMAAGAQLGSSIGGSLGI
ncbi:MAG: hypothetical protein CBC71_06320 [Rhodobacteraceae bacterium TMED111]|nr:hypothetical protein [Marinovum sp.]OUV41113.1 MAG: hypothetical protein CBC71_06320 [Rhodobacteraceae bacterium TMED111]|tara:strand:+ start:7236 stop:8294 length:1059 start_codon:yes stop_codon:yes gene_type:complete